MSPPRGLHHLDDLRGVRAAKQAVADVGLVPATGHAGAINVASDGVVKPKTMGGLLGGTSALTTPSVAEQIDNLTVRKATKQVLPPARSAPPRLSVRPRPPPIQAEAWQGLFAWERYGSAPLGSSMWANPSANTPNFRVPAPSDKSRIVERTTDGAIGMARKTHTSHQQGPS